jgi:hypothetical protein
MKTNKTKGLLMAALMLAVSTASSFAATGKIKVNPYLKTKYAIVSAVVPTSEGARLVIKDNEGNNLYVSSKINNVESFQKLIDLTTLANGTYKVVLQGKAIREISTFTVENHKLVNYSETEKVAAESVASITKKSDDMLYVSYFNPAKLTSTVAIYDSKGETVYYSALPANEQYAAIYKINELPRGNYKMELSAGNKTTKYEFAK